MKNLFITSLLCLSTLFLCAQTKEKDDTERQYIKVLRYVDGNVVTDSLSISKMPEFPGGQEAISDYVLKKFRYSRDVKPLVYGTIIVNFIVSTEGKVVKASVAKGLHPYLDMEAVKVVKSLPKWSPGMQGDKPVNIKMSLPITLDAEYFRVFANNNFSN